MRKIILTLAAHPDDTGNLQLNREIRNIKEIIKKATRRDDFQLVREDAVRWNDFQQYILKYKPRIVHFCGHGVGKDGLVLEDEHGQASVLGTEVLSSLFRQVSKFVECVLFNACYSSVQAKAINQHINYVIGMEKSIEDKVAITYAKGFYLAIGEGESIEDAHKTGCRDILQQVRDTNQLREIRKISVADDNLSSGTVGFWEPQLFVKEPPLTEFKSFSTAPVDCVLLAGSIVKILSPHLQNLLSSDNSTQRATGHVPISQDDDLNSEQAFILWEQMQSHFSDNQEIMGIATMISGSPQNDLYQQMFSQILSEKLASNLSLAKEFLKLFGEKSGVQRIISGDEAWIESVRYKMAESGTQEIKTGNKGRIQNIDMEMR